jgi:hypothetical protein
VENLRLFVRKLVTYYGNVSPPEVLDWILPHRRVHCKKLATEKAMFTAAANKAIKEQ